MRGGAVRCGAMRYGATRMYFRIKPGCIFGKEKPVIWVPPFFFVVPKIGTKTVPELGGQRNEGNGWFYVHCPPKPVAVFGSKKGTIFKTIN